MRGRTIRKLLAEGKNDSILGRRRLVLSEDTFDEVSDAGTQAVRYTALGPIVETSEYIFVYVNAVQAAVIPKRDQPPQTLENFVGELRRRVPADRMLHKRVSIAADDNGDKA